MSSKAYVASIKKKHGEVVAGKGGFVACKERASTGLFEFDLASNGGFPRGRISIVYGKEDSGKTTLALLAIAQNQTINPNQMNVFVDVENNLDLNRAQELGVDVDNEDTFVYILPDSAEKVVDIVEEALYQPNVGIVAVDSLGALITENEQESFADKVIVGGSAKETSKLARKSTLAMLKQRREGVYPALICINQIRSIIGGMTHGPKDQMPGGVAIRFASSMSVRVYGKLQVDKKIDPDVPSKMEMTATINKFKVPILQKKVTFTLNMVSHGKVVAGTTDSWNLMLTHLKGCGLLVKSKNGWSLFGKEYKVQKELREEITNDPAFEEKIKGAIFHALSTGEILDG